MANLIFLSPNNNVVHGACVGPAEVGYNQNWLIDGLPGRPLRATGGSGTWVTAPLAPVGVNFCSWISGNLDLGVSATVTGAFTTVVATQGPFTGVRRNPFGWNRLEPFAPTSSITVSVSGNSQTLIVGQFAAGWAIELERPIQPLGHREPLDFNTMPDPQMGNVEVYNERKAARVFEGRTTCSTQFFPNLEAWYDSTLDNHKYSVIVPSPDHFNDAWAVRFDQFQYKRINQFNWEIMLRFVEIPRHDWP